MKLNQLPKGILMFSTIEIVIGFVTLSTITFSLIAGLNTKPLNVLIFVYITSVLSFILGIGLLKLNRQAHELLLFFTGVIILTKILTVFGIMRLNGALETGINANVKNALSILYHLLLWCYLGRKDIKSFLAKSGV